VGGEGRRRRVGVGVWGKAGAAQKCVPLTLVERPNEKDGRAEEVRPTKKEGP